MFAVYDSTGKLLRGDFQSKLGAQNFCAINNRMDWKIKEVKPSWCLSHWTVNNI